jgi:hypothetical protein
MVCLCIVGVQLLRMVLLPWTRSNKLSKNSRHRSFDLPSTNMYSVCFINTVKSLSSYNQRCLGVQFTTLGAEKTYHNDIELSHDETWSSWCLDVTIGMNLPEMPANIRELLPSTFYNFKVFYNPAQTSEPEQSQSSQSQSQSSSQDASEPDGQVFMKRKKGGGVRASCFLSLAKEALSCI